MAFGEQDVNNLKRQIASLRQAIKEMGDQKTLMRSQIALWKNDINNLKEKQEAQIKQETIEYEKKIRKTEEEISRMQKEEDKLNLELSKVSEDIESLSQSQKEY